MGKVLERLTPSLIEFIGRQPLFFVATAPAQGRINVSPKGLDTLRVLSERCVAYLDLTGSGNETAAHLLSDGRMTMMFCSFDRAPMVLRLHGRGRVVRPRDAGWENVLANFTAVPGMRQVVVLDVTSVQTSCGFGVPVMEVHAERGRLERWAKNKSPEQIERHWREKNSTSIDGLPTHLVEP